MNIFLYIYTLQAKLDYLKLDIEGFEWDVLEDMLSSEILQAVKQLAFEIHTKHLMHCYYGQMWKVKAFVFVQI